VVLVVACLFPLINSPLCQRCLMLRLSRRCNAAEPFLTLAYHVVLDGLLSLLESIRVHISEIHIRIFLHQDARSELEAVLSAVLVVEDVSLFQCFLS
jgi:hypothetical protein